MLLLDEDVKRIIALGYDEQFFAKKDSDGFKVLQNSGAGRCVFHDGSQCTIYENRPKGCKLYPIIFDENSMSAVRDKLCPYRNEFSLTQKEKKELWNIYPRLLSESSQRIKESQK
jgi:Fe-S-cluster containining protein